jgi:hypothetical protein
MLACDHREYRRRQNQQVLQPLLQRSCAAKLGRVDNAQRMPSVRGREGGGAGSPQAGAVAEALASGVEPRAVVLVEGVSDQHAVQALAGRRGRDLAGEGIWVVPMGGASTIGRFLALFGPQGLDVKLAGLCDAGEVRDFQRGLERAGLGSDLTVAEMEALGFYVCVADLEDELIRALGVAAVERVVEAQGELGSFRTFQRQPAQRERTTDQQLRRFMGTRAGRKFLYARLLVEALDLTQVPRPLDRILSHV